MDKKHRYILVMFIATVFVLLLLPATVWADATAPGRPSADAISVSYRRIDVEWNRVSGADGYTIHRAGSASGPYKRIYTAKSGRTVKYADTGLTTGKKYYYKVRAYASGGSGRVYGRASAIVSAASALAVPKAATTPVSCNSVSVTWGRVSGADGYIIHRAESAGGPYRRVYTAKSGSTLSYLDTGLTTGTKYYYKVRAYRSGTSGRAYSRPSKVVSAMLAPEAPVITTVPVSYKSIEVSWDNVSGANRYRVYRRGAEEDTYQLIEVTTRTSYIDTDLVTGKRYYYKVRACHRDGDTRVLSGYSAVRSATPRLSQPEISTETASYNSIEVSWNRISGASGYIVYRADSETGAYKKIARVKGGSKRSYTNKSLVTGKTYYYKVSAYRTAGGVTKYSWRSGSESAAGMHTIYYQGDPQWRFPSSVARKACVMTAYAIAINSMGVDATPRDVYKSNGCETMMDVCSLEENFGVKPVCALCSDSKYLSCFDGHKTYIANPSRNGLRAVKEALSRHPEGVILWFKRGSKSHAVVACLNIDGTIYFSDPGRKRDALLTFKDTWVYYAYRMNYGDIAEMIALDFE